MPGSGILDTLRAQTRPSVITAYSHFHETNRQRAVQLRHLCTNLSLVSILFHDILHVLKHPLSVIDFGIPRPRLATTTQRGLATTDTGSSSARSGGSGSRFSLETLSGEAKPNRFAHWIRDPGPTNAERIHTFTAPEVRALYMACGTVFEKCLLTALFTTAMRIGGFSRLERAPALSVGDAGGVVAGREAYSIEKGYKRVCYGLSEVLCALLVQWDGVGCATTSRYLFPARDHPELPVSVVGCMKTFRRVAARAGPSGRHVHPHTTRHTVAWTLKCLGNSTDNVAGFVGHKSARITSDKYIALSAQERREAMNIPWLKDVGGGESLRDRALELACAIASPFGSADGRTFPVLAAAAEAVADRPTPKAHRRQLERLQRIERIATLKGRLGLLD